MPSMIEIYQKYASNYDELIEAEDYSQNLNKFLFENLNLNNKIIYEAGIGTGRLTKIYINEINQCYGFDREQHMLNQCKQNLSGYMDKITLCISKNENLKMITDKADIFIEGWSFGHTIIENENNYKNVFMKIFNQICEIVKKNGKIVLIESLGTNVNEPKVKSQILEEFFTYIEDNYNFNRSTISTDYKFENYHEAARIMGFFFGNEMYDNIILKKLKVIPEFTGIWMRDNE